jgi:hypothetical protein
MSNHQKRLIAFLIQVVSFIWLFYEKQPGLNVLAFTLIQALSYLFIGALNRATFRFIVIGHLVLAFFYMWNFNTFTFYHWVINSVLIAGSIASELFSIPQGFQSAVRKYFDAIPDVVSRLNGGVHRKQKPAFQPRLFVIPMSAFLFFFGVYRIGSDAFDIAVGETVTNILAQLEILIDGVFWGLLVLGIIAALPVTFQNDRNTLMWKRPKSIFINRNNFNKINNRLSEGIITLSSVSALLLILVYIEISDVWFDFKWSGQFLKNFVHEGTWALVLSIVVSIFLTIYYLDVWVEHVKRHRMLKVLAAIWLLLNGILLVSVVVRTGLYIKYFGLAYRRIGLLFFLVCCLSGLILTWWKIKHNLTVSDLIRLNSKVIYVALVSTSIVCWDQFIPKFNLNHAERSFVDLEYLKGMSYKSLLHTDLSQTEMASLNVIQLQALPFVAEDYHIKIHYYNDVQRRKTQLKDKWSDLDWREWNRAEYRAFQHIQSTD